MTFRPGDVAQLKCGGAAFVVVEEVEESGFQPAGWRCIWLIQGAPREAIFPALALQPYEPSTAKAAPD